MISTWVVGSDVPEGAPDFVDSCYKRVLPYLTEFLVAPHPHRNGVMCPFMPKALFERNIRFAFFSNGGSDAQLQELICSCVDDFKENQRGSHGAFVVLFAEDFDIKRILRAHIKAKHYCIKKEVMIGVLFKDSQAPSLHSNEYFPLRTPTPIIVLRDLTAQDLQFLNPDHYGIASKLRFVNSFIKKFDTSDAKGFTRSKVNDAKRIRREYQKSIFKITLFIGLIVSSLVAFFWVI